MYIDITKTNEQTRYYAMNYPSICFPKECRSACALFMFFTCATALAGNIAGVTSAPGVRLAAAPIAVGDDKPGHIVYKVDGQEVTKACMTASGRAIYSSRTL